MRLVQPKKENAKIGDWGGPLATGNVTYEARRQRTGPRPDSSTPAHRWGSCCDGTSVFFHAGLSSSAEVLDTKNGKSFADNRPWERR